MDMLRIYINIILLITAVNVVTCFKIGKSFWAVCPKSDGKIRTFFDISFYDCAKECINRPLCKAYGHRRYMNVCELYTTDETEDDNTCVTVRKEDIAVENGEVPCSCQDGKTCDPSTGECVYRECKVFAKVDHGRVLGNMNHIGARLMVKCDQGWEELSLQSSMTCLQNGNWSYMPACARHVIACEGPSVKLSCTQEFQLRIVSAVFGRTKGGDICPSSQMESTNCVSPNSTAIAKEECDGKKECDLGTNSYLFGDPCPKTYKYLEVKYTCL